MRIFLISFLAMFLFLSFGCSPPTAGTNVVPHEGAWGIYALELSTENVVLIMSSSEAISFLALSRAGDRFAFSMRVGGTVEANEEIFTVKVDGSGLTQLTNNSTYDLYPSYSPDDTKLGYLSKPGSTLGLYTMNADGSNQQVLYDSAASHEADPDWGAGDRIVFTQSSRIWTIQSDGTDIQPVTDLANAGEWGIANLPAGDYDPRFNPAGTKIAFERMSDPNVSVHGSYDIFSVNPDGSGETRLTTTGYAQGLPIYSHAGDQIVFIVSAINDEGKYDIYLMNSDGTSMRNITPGYFPANFLCHSAIFSKDDSKIYFAGQWY